MADKDLDISDFFEDDETLEMFQAELEDHGLVSTTNENGTVIAFSLDKLQELVKLATDDPDKKVIIFIGNKIIAEMDPEGSLPN